jgi:hypothetical protein
LIWRAAFGKYFTNEWWGFLNVEDIDVNDAVFDLAVTQLQCAATGLGQSA